MGGPQNDNASDSGSDVDPGVCQVLVEEIVELRWRVLVVTCFLTFGSYYVADFPGSIGTGGGKTIERYFRDHGKEYTQQMNQWLYSAYSWPNTVLSIFGGLLIDKFLGIRWAMLLFTGLVLLGSALFWLGVQVTNFWVLVAGRVILGIGSESLAVAQSAYVARWFSHARGVALAFGMTISFSRVGSSFNFMFSPKIAESFGVDYATLVGVFACCLSVAACLCLIAADFYAVRIGYIRPEPQTTEEGVMKMSDMCRLPLTFWALTFLCTFSYTALFPFIGIARNFFEVKYGYSGDVASQCISAYQLSAVIGSPLIGFIVDSVGSNSVWLLFSSVAIAGVHSLLITTMIPGRTIMILLGVVYSFLAAGLWPSIPLAVEKNIVGVSYGVMTALQNIGLALFPIALGKILDSFPRGEDGIIAMHSMESGKVVLSEGDTELPPLEAYQMAELLFIGSAAVAFISDVVLILADISGKGVLTASSCQRRKMKAEEEESLLNHSPDEENTLTYLTRES
uniref:Lysosomal dipeptide transporter MFSD1 n=1 Tax=Trypanosoma congolense (strain IL3000) TaxID=1068625 RepID=F9WEU0_TRYCI|nr:unnamed protein product [Trypanosoma congolense IL3000]